jgi:predicted RNA methylase
MITDQKSLRKFKRDTNFFETPQPIADRMAYLIDDVGRNARILEPSAGRGALIKAVQRAVQYSIKPVEFCETQIEFHPSLSELGAACAARDFEQFNPGPLYDAIIMNPPYRNRAAEKHVDHAWDCLKPGGKIVALVGTSAAEWIDDEFSGHVFEREVFAKGFSETSITTVLFLIHKPL